MLDLRLPTYYNNPMPELASATASQASALAGGIDLHAHTTASDGSLSPTELVRAAHALGLSAIAVTDHDTTDGLSEAGKAAQGLKITVIPGVELSVEDEGGRFHLLGYGINPHDEGLNTALITLRESRAARNELMAQRMAELGLPLTMDDVRAEAGPDSQVIARPHFAQALLKRGLVTSVQDAFDRYLASGKPLYLPKDVLTPRLAISYIHDAGGVAVMAHPGLVPLAPDALAARIAALAAQDGMDGIEAYYSQHSQAQTARFLDLARQNQLIVTGGSDFHGTPKPHVPLGIVYQGQAGPASLLQGIYARQDALYAARHPVR